MTATGSVLGALSLLLKPQLRKTRIGPGEAVLGFGSAGILYGLLMLGALIVSHIVWDNLIFLIWPTSRPAPADNGDRAPAS
ncbi:MAG: hypothetical protein IIC78_06185 [Chloroflexi bacterium]|nr:hypothetical protein [Chloroflexota bacterium]